MPLLTFWVLDADDTRGPNPVATNEHPGFSIFPKQYSDVDEIEKELQSRSAEVPEGSSFYLLFQGSWFSFRDLKAQSDSVPTAINQDRLYVLVRKPKTEQAGPVDNEDVTYIIREKVSQPVQLLPDIGELSTFLQQIPADDLHFPVPENWFFRLPELNRRKIFKRALPGQTCLAIIPLVNDLINPPAAMETEDTFHHLWDTLINDVLRFFFTRGTWVHVRNRSGEGSSGILRPNMVARFGVYALWRGEEKGPNTEGNPAEELISKLDWTYGSSIPYLLAYYARAYLVTFCAIYTNNLGKQALQDLKAFNLQIDHDRVELCIACRNIARLLPVLQQLCYSAKVESDIDVLDRPSGKRIEFYGRKVEKFINPNSFGRVLSIYRELASEPRCPYSEVLLHAREKNSALVFERGIRTRPATEVELVTCLSCICKALVWLHVHGFMHRDIRWENVVKSRTDDSWILVDFDAAERSPCNSALVLDQRTHAPEMAHGWHDVKVDIWGVGYLLRTTSVLLRSNLEKLRDSCLSTNPSDRPRAEECLACLEANPPTSF